jgi:hypothetical protein
VNPSPHLQCCSFWRVTKLRQHCVQGGEGGGSVFISLLSVVVASKKNRTVDFRVSFEEHPFDKTILVHYMREKPLNHPEFTRNQRLLTCTNVHRRAPNVHKCFYVCFHVHNVHNFYIKEYSTLTFLLKKMCTWLFSCARGVFLDIDRFPKSALKCTFVHVQKRVFGRFWFGTKFHVERLPYALSTASLTGRKAVLTKCGLTSNRRNITQTVFSTA